MKAKKLGSVLLRDVTEKRSSRRVTVEVERDGRALLVRPAGCSVKGLDGECAPILLELYEGDLKLYVWADINQEDPTHIIDLSGALETNRKEE